MKICEVEEDAGDGGAAVSEGKMSSTGGNEMFKMVQVALLAQF